jgi:heat shock protein HslJ
LKFHHYSRDVFFTRNDCMKIYQLWLPIGLGVLLAACSAEKGNEALPVPAAVTVPDMHNSQNALDWAGIYQGILVCTDCPGIKTRLTLANDGSYTLESQALKQDAQALSVSGRFTWQPDGNTIVLDSAGAGQQFAVGEGRLILLNPDGTKPGSDAADRSLQKVPADQPASDAVTVAFLQDHRWLLESASTGANQRIDALFPKDRPFEFSFTGTNMAVTGGCNGLRGSYQINAEGQFVAGRMISTMMACEPALMAADKALSELLSKPLRIMLVQGPQPTLILLSANNEVLMLTGQKTPEAMYGPAARVFLEVAAQTVACDNPPSGQTQCLQVREIKFDDKGLKTGSPGEWQPFNTAIEGYQHTPGVRNVIRVNRFQPASSSADVVAPAVYVLDMVVESESKSQ